MFVQVGLSRGRLTVDPVLARRVLHRVRRDHGARAGAGPGQRRSRTPRRTSFATPCTAFFKVTLPLILPGIVAGFLLAFVLSLDDFVITNFVNGTTNTFPTWVYGATRVGMPPQVNVWGTVLFLRAS